MRKQQGRLLVGFLIVTVLVVGASLIAGQRPQLGLDLKGGVSVVLKPTTETQPDTLDRAIEIIRNRIDSLGVAERDRRHLEIRGESDALALPVARRCDPKLCLADR